MFAALLAALMSTLSSYLNSASTIWTTDLYGRVRQLITGRAIGERHALLVGRAFTLAFMLSGGLLAPQMDGQETMYNFIQGSLSIFQGPVFAILLLGILWPRTTQWGGLAALILGVAFTTILHNTDDLFPSENPFLFVAWWSFVFSIIVAVVVSLLTKPEPDDKIRGLVFGQVMKDGQMQRILQERVNGNG
jgi:Na+/proline symporter